MKTKQVEGLVDELASLATVGGPNLVYETVLEATTQTIDVTGLNYSLAKYYEVFLDFITDDATSTSYKLYAGDPTLDTTDSNYHTREVLMGPSTTTTNFNYPALISTTSSGWAVSLRLLTGQHADGSFFHLGFGYRGGINKVTVQQASKSVTQFSNVTALRFSASAAPGFPVGTTIRIYKFSGPPDTKGSWDVIIEDQKAQNTPAGSFDSGADRTRTLNTLVSNVNSLATLSSNQFTLPSGIYDVSWSAPAHNVGRHQTLLYDVTNTVEVARGANSFSLTGGGGSTTRSQGATRLTLSASTTFELRHRCESTKSSDGFGVEGNFGTEVYAQVYIKRVGSNLPSDDPVFVDIDNGDSPYTLAAANTNLFVDASAGDVTVNLPPVAGNGGLTVIVRAVDLTNDVVIAPDGSDNLEGANSSYSFTTNVVSGITLLCKATGSDQGWWIV